MNVPVSQRRGIQLPADVAVNWAALRKMRLHGEISEETHDLTPYSNQRYAIDILHGARFKYSSENFNPWRLLDLAPKDKVRIQYKHRDGNGGHQKATICARSLKFVITRREEQKPREVPRKAPESTPEDYVQFRGKRYRLTPGVLHNIEVILETEKKLGSLTEVLADGEI